MSRRRFCAGACRAASSVTLATLLGACSGDASPPAGPTPMPGGFTPLPILAGQFAGGIVQVTVAGTALAAAGGAALVQSVAGEFLVARTGADSVTAVDAICTHESCTVTGAEGTVYVCPCHGSRYDRTGRVIGGPAQASLRQYAVVLADGVVAITL